MTEDIPVGAHDPNRLSNIGIGHGAIDGGGGYTYLNPATGHELSGVAGFTYNFKNPDTQVQSGVDFYFDWMLRGLYRIRSLSVLLAMPISKSPMTLVDTRF